MKNAILYAITVLIWGSTWMVIEYQLGEVAIEVSLFYRFALAGIGMVAIAVIRGHSFKFSYKQHGYIALLGLLNFSLNYALLYEAQKHLNSAIASIVFSTLLLFNIVNTRLFFGKAIPVKTYIGALVGVIGLCFLFWPQLMNFNGTQSSLMGLGLGLAGVFAASLGNMVSVRNSNNNYPILPTTGLAMIYGSLLLLVYALQSGATFIISSSPAYWGSLAYLIIFGSIIAFYSYFVLLKNIGPEKTSYSIVLFPLVAIILSSIFEGFSWDIYSLSGFALIGLGNLIILFPKQLLAQLSLSMKIKKAPIGIVTSVLISVSIAFVYY